MVKRYLEELKGTPPDEVRGQGSSSSFSSCHWGAVETMVMPENQPSVGFLCGRYGCSEWHR